jgi:hypothetical protein
VSRKIGAAQRLVLQALQQSPEETLGGCGVPSVLNHYVEHDAMLVDSTPEVVKRAVDSDEHLIQMPGVDCDQRAGVRCLDVALAKLRTEAPAEFNVAMPELVDGNPRVPTGGASRPALTRCTERDRCPQPGPRASV